MTPEQEAAIAQVPRYLEGMREGNGEKIAAMIYVWMAGVTTYTEIATRREINTPSCQYPDKIVDAASKDPAAWEAARMMVAALIERGDPIPPTLLRFTAAIMRDKWSKPLSGRPTDLARDLRIAHAVWMLMEAGFKKSQNSATQGAKSAFAIVGLHANLNHDAVKAVWNKLGEHVIATKKRGPYYFLNSPLQLKLEL